jgi:hypothetical protein
MMEYQYQVLLVVFNELNGNILYNLELKPIFKSKFPLLPIKSIELSVCIENKPVEYIISYEWFIKIKC